MRCTRTGYRFPDYDKRAASVLNPADVSRPFPHFLSCSRSPASIEPQNLQTPEELEEEDRAAQAAVSFFSRDCSAKAEMLTLSAEHRNCKSSFGGDRRRTSLPLRSS